MQVHANRACHAEAFVSDTVKFVRDPVRETGARDHSNDTHLDNF